MGFRRWVARLDLVPILLCAVLVELVVNRLAVPVLRPPGARTPPSWHQNLDRVGLFSFHFASVLALGVVAWKLWELVVGSRLFRKGERATLAGVGAVFLGFAAWSVLGRPPDVVAFHLETSFAALVVLVTLALAIRPAPRGVKLGLALVAVPFLVHYYGAFTLRLVVQGETARWSSLPDRLRAIGVLTLALSAVASPYCFAPGRWRRAFARPAPLAAAVFVGTVCALILRKHYEVGAEIASRGLGIELGPAAPPGALALYVMALASVTWTITATMSSSSAGYRRIGAGLALVVSAGYAFAWPLQLIVGVAGTLLVVEGGVRARTEPLAPAEERDSGGRRFQPPPIADATWRTYVERVAEALGAEVVIDSAGHVERTTIRGRKELPFTIEIEREGGSVARLDVRLGDGLDGDGASEPALTLAARPEGLIAVGQHPPPPATHAPARRIGDEAFDRRFRLQAREDLARALLDEELRARVVTALDGWLAVWPGRAVHYRVHPGRGAPLDHPIPITELAFRGSVDAQGIERLTRVVELLSTLAGRALSPARTARG